MIASYPFDQVPLLTGAPAIVHSAVSRTTFAGERARFVNALFFSRTIVPVSGTLVDIYQTVYTSRTRIYSTKNAEKEQKNRTMQIETKKHRIRLTVKYMLYRLRTTYCQSLVGSGISLGLFANRDLYCPR